MNLYVEIMGVTTIIIGGYPPNIWGRGHHYGVPHNGNNMILQTGRAKAKGMIASRLTLT